MKKTSKAFAVIELSIIMMVVGILLLNESSNNKLIRNVRILSAQNVTRSSPINSMRGLVAWFETSLESSFQINERFDQKNISIWVDNNPYSSFKKNFIQLQKPNSKPRYIENGINGIPALKFDGTDDYMAIPSIKFNSENLTIFLVGKRTSYSHYQGSISGFNLNNSDDLANGSLVAFYDQNSFTSIASGTNYSNVKGIGDNNPYILGTIFNGKKNVTYINGNIGTNSKGNPVFDFNTIFVGARYNMNQPDSFFNGHIGEIIIFNRALNSEERKSIEYYLARKFSIKLDYSL